MSNEHTCLPKTPEDVRAFIGLNFSSLEYGQKNEEPHADDTYTVSAHDLLSAFRWFELENCEGQTAATCVACEGEPALENTPCAVCGTDQPAASADINESKIAILADAMRWADVRNNYRSVEELHKSNRDFGLRIESELMLVAERAAEDASIAAPVSAEPLPDIRYIAKGDMRFIDGQWMTCTDPEIGRWQGSGSPVTAEPVAWIRAHPDGSLTTEILLSSAIENVRKQSGAWVPLCPAPVAAQAQPPAGWEWKLCPAGLSAETFTAAQAQQDANGSIYPDWASYRQGLEDGKLEAQQGTNKVDTERLDYLEKDGGRTVLCFGSDWYSGPERRPNGAQPRLTRHDSLRAAIDAARKERT